MLEQLFYPSFAGTFSNTKENRQLAEQLQRIQNGEFDENIPAVKKAETVKEANEARKKVFDQVKETALQKEKEFNAQETDFLQLWKDAFDLLEKDPLLIDYMKQHQLETVDQALESLQQHFESREPQAPEGESISNGMKELKTAYHALKKITESPGISKNPLKGLGSSFIEKNEIGQLIVSVNHLTGEKLDTKIFRGEKNYEGSLLDHVYSYYQQNEFKDIVAKDKDNKDAEQLEPLLAIHLGELSKALATRLKAIEMLAPSYELHRQSQTADMFDDEEEDFLATMENPTSFLEGYGENTKKLDKIIEDCNVFLNGDWDTKVDIIKGNDEFSELYDEYIRKVSEEPLKAVKEKALIQHKEKLQKQYESMMKERKDAIQSNAEALADYEEKKKAHAGTINEIREITEHRDYIIKKEMPKLEKLQKRKQEAIEQEELNTGEPLKYQWSVFNKEKKKLEDRISEIKADRERYDLCAPKAAKKQTGLEPELKRLNQEVKDFTVIRDYFDSLTEGNEDVRADIVNFAIESRAITSEDMANALNDTEHPERIQLLQAAINVQAGWEAFKKDHPELKNQCALVDGFKNNRNKADTDGAYDVLNREIENRKQKSSQLYNENREYLDAVKSVRDLEKKYGGKDFGEKEMTDLIRQLTELKMPEETYEAWHENLKKSADERFTTVSKFEADMNKFIQEQNGKIEKLQKVLEDADVRKPELKPVKTEEEIKQQLTEADRKFKEEELDRILEKASEKIADEHEEEGMDAVAQKIRLAKTGAENKKNDMKRTLDRMNRIFDKSQLKKEEEKKTKDKIIEAGNKLQENKNAFYQSIYLELKAFSDNMEQGKAKGHTNTEEFELMKSKAKAATDAFSGFNEEGKEPTREWVEEYLKQLKDASDSYHRKKTDGWHPWVSPMRSRRLRMSENLSAFVTEKLEAIKNFENQVETMSQKLEEAKTELEKEKPNSRAAKENEKPADYFDRIWRESRKARRQEVTDQKKEVSQMNVQVTTTRKKLS